MVRTPRIILMVAVSAVLLARDRAEAFNDHLVQAPVLEAPTRGSVAGSLSRLSFGPGDLARGVYSFPAPMDLPHERGEPLTRVVPSYSPEGGISEWGMGWQVDLAIRRHRAVGDFDYGGNDFVGPWGRLERGTDGFFYPAGLSAHVRLSFAGGEWNAVLPDGTTFRFGERVDTSFGTYAWYLTEVTSTLGDRTEFQYECNTSGRPFVTRIIYGARGHIRDHDVVLAYEPLSRPFVSYASGQALVLDRRVKMVTARLRPAGATIGAYENRWRFDLRYLQSPLGPAFYLAGIMKVYRSGESEPEVTYSYDLGDQALVNAQFTIIPELNAFVRAGGVDALQPTKSAVVDVDRNGLADLEHHYAQDLWRQSEAGWTKEPLAENPAADSRCRPAPSVYNPPRVLARMMPGADEPQALRVQYFANNVTQILICNRLGILLQTAQAGGDWSLGAQRRLVDVNRDGRPDIVVLTPTGVKILANTSQTTAGGATYTFTPQRPQYLTPTVIADTSWIHDMNGDGLVDIVRRLSGYLTIWYGQGRFRFDPQGVSIPLLALNGSYIGSLETYGLWFVDANRDGLTDALLTDGYQARLFLNQGNVLRQHPVPGLRTTNWSMSDPVLTDLSGNGNDEIVYAHQGTAYGLALNTPSTGLLVVTDDGKGSVVHFDYDRPAAFDQAGGRPSVLTSMTVESSGYDSVSASYEYRNPTVHSDGRFLVGYGVINKSSPFLLETASFHNDDDVAGLLRETHATDARTPSLEQFSEKLYGESGGGPCTPSYFAGVKWFRPMSARSGWRSVPVGLEAVETVEYLAYGGGVCPTLTRTTNAHGVLTEEIALAMPAGLANALHCLSGVERQIGMHADTSRNFVMEMELARNTVGQVTHVTRKGVQGTLLLQQVTYDSSNRPELISSPGRGTTVVAYDADTGLLKQVTTPDGIIMHTAERDALTGSIRTLLVDRGLGGILGSFYRYDGLERLYKAWRDFGGSSESEPLELLQYHFPTATTLGSIRATRIVDPSTDVFRESVSLVTADDEVVSGLFLIPEGWQVPQVISRSRMFRAETMMRRDPLAATTDPTALSHAMLGQDAVFLGETRTAAFGYTTYEREIVQSSVDRIVETSRELCDGMIVTTAVENGVHQTRTAMDTAGRVLWLEDQVGSKTDYEYDVLGRLVSVTLADGLRHTVTYDSYGRVSLAKRDGVGGFAYSYDATTGLLSQKLLFDRGDVLNRTVSYAYDAAGRVTTQTHTLADGSGNQIFQYTYDGTDAVPVVSGQRGYLTRVQGPGYERVVRYNPDGTLARKTTSVGAWRQADCRYTYYAGGELRSEVRSIHDLTQSGVLLEEMTKEHIYDSHGRLAKLRVNDADVLVITYDTKGLIHHADLDGGGQIVPRYDTITRRLSGYVHDAILWNAGVDWTFDRRVHVTRESMSFGSDLLVRDYTYDAPGFLTRSQDKVGTANYAYTTTGMPSFAGDSQGARTLERAGDEIRAGNVLYTYDLLGRVAQKGGLTQEYGPSGTLQRAQRGGGPLWEFYYDEAGNRALKTENGQAVAAYLDGTYLVATGSVEPVHLAGRLVGVLEGGVFRLLPTDIRGTLLANPGGAPLLPTPYGVRTVHPDLSSALDYIEKGYDADLGTVRMGVRDYDPLISQFTTPDPLFLESPEKAISRPVELNLYTYAGNNPVNNTDPSGLFFSQQTVDNAGGQKVFELAGPPNPSNPYEAEQPRDLPINRPFYEPFRRTTGILGGEGSTVRRSYDLTEGERKFLSTLFMVVGTALTGPAVGVEGTVARASVEAGAATARSASLLGRTFDKLGTVVRNPGLSIESFSGHGINQAITRGVSPEALLQTVRSPSVVLQQAGGARHFFLSPDAAVVLDSSGRVVTTYGRDVFRPGVLEVLKASGGG